MKYKTCKKCGIEFPRTAEFFYKSKDWADGLHGNCKECHKKYQKARKYGDGISKRCIVCKKILDIKTNFYLDKKSLDGYAMKCKSCTKIKCDITGANKKKISNNSNSRKKYLTYEERKEARRIYDYNRYWNNRDEILEKRKIRRDNGYKYISEKEKKDKVVRNQRRRANIKKLPNHFTLDQWESCKNSFDNKCCYCGQSTKLQQEHFIPVSKMGTFTANNILPSCGPCNFKKHNSDFFGWYPKQPFYSKERECKIMNYLKSMSVKEQISS